MTQASRAVDGPAQAGIHQGVPFDVYARWPYANWSMLRHFRKSPKHARSYILAQEDQTEAQRLGAGVHTAILEPDAYDDRYAVAPRVDKRTNAGKAEWAAFEAANEEREILSAADDVAAKAVGDAVHKHPWAGPLIRSKGLREVSIVWHDEEFDVTCKARLDLVCKTVDGHSSIVDPKTTHNASPFAFAKDAAKLGYHAQLASYRKGLARVLPGPARKVIIIACEKKPPYDVVPYELDDATLDEGLTLYDHCLMQYARCRESNHWPGISDVLAPLTIPGWAFEFVSMGDYQ